MTPGFESAERGVAGLGLGRGDGDSIDKVGGSAFNPEASG